MNRTLPHYTQFALLSALTLPIFEAQPEGYLDGVLDSAKNTLLRTAAPLQRQELDNISYCLKREYTLAHAISECGLFEGEIRFLLASGKRSPQSIQALVKTALQFLENFGDYMNSPAEVQA